MEAEAAAARGRPAPPPLTPQDIAAAAALAARAADDPTLVQSAYGRLHALVSGELELSSTVSDVLAPLLSAQWSLQDRWLLQQLATQPAGPALLTSLDPALEVKTLELAAGTTLLSSNDAGAGHWVIVTHTAAGTPALWPVERLPPQPGADTLRCFRAEAGSRPCAVWRLQRLSTDVGGMPRFLVEAEYTQAAGATRGHLLSLWRWDGQAATPIHAVSYTVGGEGYDEGAEAQGDVVRITSKQGFRMLQACGSCDGRQVEQRLRLTPNDEVQDLGATSLTPELDLVDELLARLVQHQPIGDLAEVLALGPLERMVSAARVSADAPLFMSEPETVRENSGRHELCFLASSADSGSLAPVLLSFTGSGTQRHLVSAVGSTAANSRSCAAPAP
jgi:hypothetical protein